MVHVGKYTIHGSYGKDINHWSNHQPKSTKFTTNNKRWFSSTPLWRCFAGIAAESLRCGTETHIWTVWSFSGGDESWVLLGWDMWKHREQPYNTHIYLSLLYVFIDGSFFSNHTLYTDILFNHMLIYINIYHHVCHIRWRLRYIWKNQVIIEPHIVCTEVEPFW